MALEQVINENDALLSLRELCDRLRVPVVDALTEIISLLERRRDLLAVGHPAWRERNLDQNLHWMEKLYSEQHEARQHFDAMVRIQSRAGIRVEDKTAQYRWRDLQLDRGSARDCPYCRKKLTPSTIAVDHRIPLVAGGTDSPENWQLICSQCNAGKGGWIDDCTVGWVNPSLYRQLVLEGKTQINLRERFHILSRARYTCAESIGGGCDGELGIFFRRAPSEGGQAVPDNLLVACQLHGAGKTKVEAD